MWRGENVTKRNVQGVNKQNVNLSGLPFQILKWFSSQSKINGHYPHHIWLCRFCIVTSRGTNPYLVETLSGEVLTPTQRLNEVNFIFAPLLASWVHACVGDDHISLFFCPTQDL